MNINYDLKLEEIIKNLNNKPKLLLHSCCGPCSSYVLSYLNNYFDITVYYYNPNIDKEEEYQKRLKEQIRLINEMFDSKIKVIDGIYNPLEYYEKVKGHEKDKEGGERCHICYKLRLEKCAKYALDNGFDYFTTTLSVSPYKNAKVLNEIGKSLEEKYNIKYLYADFKKKDGYKKSIMYSKEYNLYRQDYCGCVYSKTNKKEETYESLN